MRYNFISVSKNKINVNEQYFVPSNCVLKMFTCCSMNRLVHEKRTSRKR